MIEDFKKYYGSKTSSKTDSKTDSKNLEEIADRLIWMASRTPEAYSRKHNAEPAEVVAMLYYRSEEERNEILKIIEQKNKYIHSGILGMYEHIMKQPNAKELLTKATTTSGLGRGYHYSTADLEKYVEKTIKRMEDNNSVQNSANQIPEEYKNLPIKDDDGMGQK